MQRVLIPLAEGVEELEAITILDVLRRGNINAIAISMDDELLDVVGAHDLTLGADICWDYLELDVADMIVLPGGMMGMNLLRADSRILEMIRQMDAKGNYVAAICAAPAILQAAGILKGRKATIYPGMEKEIPDADIQRDQDVVVDNNLITSRGPGTALAFALTLLEILTDRKTRDAVAAGMLVKA